MMEAEVIRGEVQPPVKEVILKLTLQEAQVLRHVGNWASNATEGIGVRETDWTTYKTNEVWEVIQRLYYSLGGVPRRA